jgi:hypothetical protein
MKHQPNGMDFRRIMTSTDQSYFRMRADEEDLLAIAATSSQARARHEELAQLYRARVRFGSIRYGELPIRDEAQQLENEAA